MKRCTRCEVEKPLEAFYKVSGTDRPRPTCKPCLLADQKERRDADPEACRDKVARSRRGARDKAVAHLGGRCVSCGVDDPRVLQLDHVHGGGNEDRRKRHRPWRHVATDPAGTWQVLCANCHAIKTYEELRRLPYEPAAV